LHLALLRGNLGGMFLRKFGVAAMVLVFAQRFFQVTYAA